MYELTCDDTVCPPDSFCLSDYDSGGSRCHCNLGRSGDTCTEGEESGVKAHRKGAVIKTALDCVIACM